MELTIDLKDDSKLDLLLDALRRLAVEDGVEMIVYRVERQVLFDSMVKEENEENGADG